MGVIMAKQMEVVVNRTIDEIRAAVAKSLGNQQAYETKNPNLD